MSNEKHSDNWIGKLEELESLPGEASFNKAAAWDRLHQRMDGKKTKKRGIWYWAAACLFLAVIALLLLVEERKAHFPPPASYVENPDKNKMQEVAADITETTVAVKSPPVSVPGDSPVRRKPLPVKEKKPAIISDVATILPPVIKAIPHPDTMLAETSAVAAVPKKMRVVHINDVGGDVIGNAYVYPEHKQFKIGLSGPAGFASQIVADKTQKTTLSPKN